MTESTRYWIQDRNEVDEIMESEAPDIVKLENVINPILPEIPKQSGKSSREDTVVLPRRESGKKKRRKNDTNVGPTEDRRFFAQDAPYIYAAFKEQYGIDLLSQEKLHWWKFLALFESLGEETKMAKIMYYRTVSTSGMSKDRRAFVNEMKKAYKLDEGKKLTLEERNQQ